MTAPITPDERAAMRERAEHGNMLSPTHARRLLDDLDAAEAEVARLTPPCDGGCSYNDGPAEECSAHGRPVAEVWGIVTEVQRQRDEARAEVARPAPVWDEDTVTEAVARAMFPHFFTDDRQPLRVFTETRSDAELREAERESARRKARQALAVVREHLPVRPDREAAGRAAFEAAQRWYRDTYGRDSTSPAWDKIEDETDREMFRAQADGVLALWPGESRATVQAEALRDAADAMDADVEVRDPLRLRADWLRARADRLSAEGGES